MEVFKLIKVEQNTTQLDWTRLQSYFTLKESEIDFGWDLLVPIRSPWYDSNSWADIIFVENIKQIKY